MRIFIIACALFMSACAASGPAYDRAVSLHNVYRQVVLDVDQVYAPVYAEAAKEADAANPSDEAAFKKSMAPFEAVLVWLKRARDVEQTFQFALSAWADEASGDKDRKEASLKSSLACASDAVEKLSQATGQVPSSVPSPLYAAAFAIESQLKALADGTTCPVEALQ